MKKNPRFERIKGTCGRPFDTVNIAKDKRREAVYLQVRNRFNALADSRGRLPTDYRTSAFDLFTNWLARECFDDNGESLGLWRLGMRQTYHKVLAHIRMYRLNAAKQYAAGYFEKPAFLNV